MLFCLHVDNGEFINEDKSIDKSVVAQCTEDSSLGLSKSCMCNEYTVCII